MRAYLARATAQDRSTIPMIALSRIAHSSCPYANPSANYRPAAYKRWVRGFADALGSFHVMVLVEPDRVARNVRVFPPAPSASATACFALT